MADYMCTDLVLAALDVSGAERGGDAAVAILHASRESHSTTEVMKQASERYGVRCSMGETDIGWDNAGAGSLWSTFKCAHYYRHTLACVTELVAAVDNWMNINGRRRRHPRS